MAITLGLAWWPDEEGGGRSDHGRLQPDEPEKLGCYLKRAWRHDPRIDSKHCKVPQYSESLMEIDAAEVVFDDFDSADVAIGGKMTIGPRRDHIAVFYVPPAFYAVVLRHTHRRA